MKTYPLRQIAAALFCFGAANFAAAGDSTDSVVTAVFSRSFNKYERPTRPDGSDKILTYVIANGGVEPGMYADASMDDVKFAGVVRVLGKYLAKQAYFPAKDGKKADLMLVVHWGKTKPGNDEFSRNLQHQGLDAFAMSQQEKMGTLGQSSILGGSGQTSGPAQEQLVQGLEEIRFAQDARNEADRYNANLLGYTAELSRRDNPSLYGGAGTAYHDLIEDIESERFYIAVTAFDFQEALQHKKKKGLWRTVASIDARGNRFDERLSTMLDKASRYFGRDSGRLMRQFEYTPHINLGELKSLGVVEPSPPAKK
jgi:hypothetical protein